MFQICCYTQQRRVYTRSAICFLDEMSLAPGIFQIISPRARESRLSIYLARASIRPTKQEDLTTD